MEICAQQALGNSADDGAGPLGVKPADAPFSWPQPRAGGPATQAIVRGSGRVWEGPALPHPGIRGLWQSGPRLPLLCPSWATARGAATPLLLSSLVLGRGAQEDPGPFEPCSHLPLSSEWFLCLIQSSPVRG